LSFNSKTVISGLFNRFSRYLAHGEKPALFEFDLPTHWSDFAQQLKWEKDGPGGKKETHIPKKFYVWPQKKVIRCPQKKT
jgi:hypothetical protein